MRAAKSLEVNARSRSLIDRIVDRIPTYMHDFKENPRWLLMFVLGRTMIGRDLHRQIEKRSLGGEGQALSNFPQSAGAILSALKSDGLYTGLRLAPKTLAAIDAFARSTPCFGNHDRKLDRLPGEFIDHDDPQAPITSGHYFERIKDCDAITSLSNDALFHEVAREYLGDTAQIISCRLWWSFPAKAALAATPQLAENEMLHFDLDDWRMLKVFFYITPVTPESGPHLYVRKSHKKRLLRHQLSITVGMPLKSIVRSYGEENLVRVVGEAGEGFVEDPFGFHAGSLASDAPRLMLEIGFGVTPPGRRRFYGERVLN